MMFDFPFQQPSIYTALYCIASYFYIVLIGRNKFISGKGIRWNQRFSTITMFFIYVLISAHAINGDFFHLMEIVHNYQFISGADYTQEEIFILIAKIVDKNYLLFRLIVWGIGFACVVKIFKSLEVNEHFAIWGFLTCYSILFTYARAAVAASIYFLGLVLIIKDKRNFFIKIVGLGLILFSYQFHRSMLILILLTPLLYVPLNKGLFYIAILAMPAIIMVVRLAFSNALNEISMFDNEVLQGKLENYSELEARSQSLRTIVMNLLRYLTLYIPFLVSSYFMMFKGLLTKVSSRIKKLYIFTFWLMIATTAVSYLNIEYNIFFYRMLFMTIIPSTVIFVYLLQLGFIRLRLAKQIVYFCIISQMVNYLYMVYLNVLH